MTQSDKAICLLSGGLDSITALAIARQRGYAVYALSFRYGQRNSGELDCARRLATRHRVVEHRVIDFDLRQIGGSALTSDIDVPKDRAVSAMGHGVPITYVPARNTIFLSFALAWAEVLGANDIFLGVNALDYSGYPDCRPDYIHAFETLSNLATRAGTEQHRRFRIHTPLIELSKADIIRQGVALGVDYGETSSCYDPADDGEPCLHCDACLLRAKGFVEAGLLDPLLVKFGITQ